MAERITTGYRRLFDVRLLHHYWLDEGATVFDALPEASQTRRLLTYDVRTILTVTPTISTRVSIAGLKGVFKPTGTGWVVAVPADTIIPDDALFTFFLTVADPNLLQYTALTIPKRPIVELYHEPDKTTYRYKENVPLVSNLTGVTRGLDDNQQLFLSKEIPPSNPTNRIESLVRTAGGALRQLTSDPPGASAQVLNSEADQMPVFLHQADLADLLSPAGLVGVPAKGIRLHDGIPDDVFALVQIAATRPDDALFTCTEPVGGGTARVARAMPPVFHLRIKNRSTVRQYRNRSTNAIQETEASPSPLTYFGNARPKQKPPHSPVVPDLDADTPGRITRLVSEVFV